MAVETKLPEKSLAKVGAEGMEKALQIFKIEDIQPATIKQYLCPQATDQEIIQFIYTCRQLNLNPFLKQIYLVKYGGSPAQFIISFKEYLKKAFAEPNYRGYTVAEIMEGSKITGARCVIYFKDGRVPFEWVAWMSENNKNQSSWLSQPRLMIRKCAIKQAHDYGLAHVYRDFAEYEVAEPGEITALEHPEEIKSIAQTKTDEGFYAPPAGIALENTELDLARKPKEDLKVDPKKYGAENGQINWSKFWPTITEKGYTRTQIHTWATEKYGMKESLRELTTEQLLELVSDIEYGLVKK